MKVHQVDGTECVHILWPMNYCAKAGANLCSLTCKLLQWNKMKRNYKNNITLQSSEGNIILDCHIEAHDSWLAIVDFFHETGHERAQSAMPSTKKILTPFMPSKAILKKSLHMQLLRQWVFISLVCSDGVKTAP